MINRWWVREWKYHPQGSTPMVRVACIVYGEDNRQGIHDRGDYMMTTVLFFESPLGRRARGRNQTLLSKEFCSPRAQERYVPEETTRRSMTNLMTFRPFIMGLSCASPFAWWPTTIMLLTHGLYTPARSVTGIELSPVCPVNTSCLHNDS